MGTISNRIKNIKIQVTETVQKAMETRVSLKDDDPKEVLAFLNYLGFVGITAEQLKAFMKDLKLYRKIKERDRQQQKEDMKNKIINKQQNLYKAILGGQNKQNFVIQHPVSADYSNFNIDNSFVKVRVRCISDDKENIDHENCKANYVDLTEKECAPETKSRENSTAQTRTRQKSVAQAIKSYKLSCDQDSDKHDSINYMKTKNKCENLESCNNIMKTKTKREKLLEPQHYISAPNLREQSLEPVINTCLRSASSMRNSIHSGTKSFIRPWRLQPENQKSTGNKKSDPVTMYQNYQQKWKQMSFPGEAKHTRIRWAIREKMLGADSKTLPLPKKSISMSTLTKK